MKIKTFVLSVLILAASCFAQNINAPSYQVNLSFLTGGPYAQNSALDVSFGGQFSTNNMLQGDFLTMPAPSYTGYLGGDSYNLCGIPVIENALATTSLSCGKFAPMLTGEVGLGRLNPVAGTTTQGLAALAGFGVGYDPTGAGHFGLLFKGGWGHFGPSLPGLSGNGFYFYSGINFGGGTSQSATQAKLMRLHRAEAKKLKKFQARQAKADKG